MAHTAQVPPTAQVKTARTAQVPPTAQVKRHTAQAEQPRTAQVPQTGCGGRSPRNHRPHKSQEHEGKPLAPAPQRHT